VIQRRCRCRAAGGWIGLGWDLEGMVVGNACIATMARSAWGLSPVGRTRECSPKFAAGTDDRDGITWL
jgi:hypothetical protein